MSISRDEVSHIASLARLALSDVEKDSLTHDLAEILEYVKKLDALDDPGADRAGHAGAAQSGVVRPGGDTPFRLDRVTASLPVERALGQSADHDEQFFRVPAVIEREDA